MGVSVLADTGALLALLDRWDLWHSACDEAFQQIRLPLGTSEAVLTELFHLIGPGHFETELVWKLLRSGAIELFAITHAELPPIHNLMSRYADRPMDFADATLVYLAKREGISTIFTVDHADFETYRIEGRKKFRVLPVGRPKK